MNYRIILPSDDHVILEASSLKEAFYFGVVTSSKLDFTAARYHISMHPDVPCMEVKLVTSKYIRVWYIGPESISLQILHRQFPISAWRYKPLWPCIEQIKYKHAALLGIDSSLGFDKLLDVL